MLRQLSYTDNLFHAIRLFFLFIAQKKGLFAIHSASILYHDKAWLFSGHSGRENQLIQLYGMSFLARRI